MTIIARSSLKTGALLQVTSDLLQLRIRVGRSGSCQRSESCWIFNKIHYTKIKLLQSTSLRVVLWRFVGTIVVILPLSTSHLFGQSAVDIDAAKLHHFEKHVRPALTKYCLECHATNTEANGGLVLDSRYGWEQGGDSGEAVVPGHPAESRLLKAIRYDDPKLQMPPEKKLPPDVVAVFEAWIADGAYDPRVGNKVSSQKPSEQNLASAVKYWSYQPLLLKPDSFKLKKAVAASIDVFVNQKLEAAEILAAPSAERRDQVRRLYFDLTGLPPSPEAMKEMLSAPNFESAYRELVDDLLASPHYGEAFARRWMDVARYAESVTLRGLVFKEAWRYRDYLVKSFGQDRPFDQMIREQIAGDLLRTDDSNERWMQLVATSFLAMGDTNFEKQDKQQLEMDYVDEQLDVIGQAFLGQTVGCARCHDHKFDPIPTKDYYALAGILKSAVALRHSNVSNWIDQPLPLSSEEERQFAKLESDLLSVDKDLAAKKKQATTAAKSSVPTKPKSPAVPTEPKAQPVPNEPTPLAGVAAAETAAKALADEIKALETQQKSLQEQVDLRPKYLTIVEEELPKDLPIHIRGDVHNLGEVVPRGFLAAIEMKQPNGIPDGVSGRLEFAQWVSSAENPLTARVYANRVWSWLMGQGIVDSVNNFGTTGSVPTHPELLDWLAAELIRNNWSTKHLVRLIVLSDAYRRKVSDPFGAVAELDPDNRLYWRGHQRRLTAEELRDAMLQASDELDTTLRGTIMKPATKSDGNYKHASTRRSIYSPLFRNSLPELFDAFDFPSSGMSVGQRSRSTVSTQALVLMNNAWVHARAKAMAARLRSESDQDDPVAWIGSAYQKCFQRSPSIEELGTCLKFFEPKVESRVPEQLERLAHTLLASIDFRYLE